MSESKSQSAESVLAQFLQHCDSFHRGFFASLVQSWRDTGQAVEISDHCIGLCIRSVLASENRRLPLFRLLPRSEGVPERIETDLRMWKRLVGEEEVDRLLQGISQLDAFVVERDADDRLTLPHPAHQGALSLKLLQQHMVSYARRGRALFPV